MAFKCTVQFAFQIVAIILALIGIFEGIATLFLIGDFNTCIRGIYAIIFALVLGCVEIYVFSFFGYFGFLLKFWGKGIMYLIMGFLVFSAKAAEFVIAFAVIFWVCGVLFIIIGIFFPVAAPPLMQGLICSKELSIHVSSSEIYEK